MSEPNDCPRLMEAHRLWEGELEGRHAAEVRRHVTDCASCRAASAEWDRLSGLLARGDPAASLAPEHRQHMRADLLAACAATLAEPNGAVARDLSRPPLRPWRLRLRLTLTLISVSLAALWLVQAVRHASPNKTVVVSRPDVPLPVSAMKPRTGSSKTNGRGIAGTLAHPVGLTHESGFRLVQTGVSNPGARRARLRHSHKSRPPLRLLRFAVRPHRALRLTNVPPHETSDRTRPRPVTQVAVPPADPPIERLVIQADAPRPVPVRTVTHLTVIAAGDLKAPGAQLTVVKSEKEEAVP